MYGDEPYICISEQQCQSHPIKDGERFLRSPSFIIYEA